MTSINRLILIVVLLAPSLYEQGDTIKKPFEKYFDVKYWRQEVFENVHEVRDEEDRTRLTEYAEHIFRYWESEYQPRKRFFLDYVNKFSIKSDINLGLILESTQAGWLGYSCHALIINDLDELMVIVSKGYYEEILTESDILRVFSPEDITNMEKSNKEIFNNYKDLLKTFKFVKKLTPVNNMYINDGMFYVMTTFNEQDITVTAAYGTVHSDNHDAFSYLAKELISVTTDLINYGK